MRTRFAVIASILSGLVGVMAPGTAAAAPRHDDGLTINATPNPIVAGDGVLIYGQLDGPSSSDQTIYLYHRIHPRPYFSLVGRTTTNAMGFYEFVRPDGLVYTNRDWFVRGPAHTHSRTVFERVMPQVTLAASTDAATTGQPVLLSGGVVPNHPFERIKLQEQNAVNGNGWHTIARAFTDADSSFSVPKRWRVPGIYTLRAVLHRDRRNIVGASSDVSVTVQQRQHRSFTIDSSSPVIADGQSVTLSGTLYAPGSTTTPEPTTEVTLYGRQHGGRLEALATTTTDSSGNYSFIQTPDHNTVYRVATTLKPRHTTANLFEGVQDVVTIDQSSAGAEVGGSVTFAGGVTPDHTGHIIYLQQLDAAGHWQDVQAGVVGTGSAYSFTYTFGQTGSFQLRARIDGGPENIGGASPALTVTVSGVEPPASLPPAG
jgi:hypothetical protein